MRRVLMALSLVFPVLAVSCAGRNPVGPTSSTTLDGFVQALRQQGLNVSVAGQIPPDVNRFFSVPAQQIRVNDRQVNAFVYATPQDAAAEAASVSADGQPSPRTRIRWVSTPRFYRQDALMVLYVGCSAEIIQALQATVGAPFAVGPTACGPPSL
jgi:hypothetical protein